MDLIDIYSIFHPKAAEYTFLSNVHGTFSCIDHMLGHKANLGKFKKTEIILIIFSDHNTMRLEINDEKKTVKNTNMWRLKNVLLNNQWMTGETKDDIKKYLETNENENTMNYLKPMGHNKSSSKKEVSSSTNLPQETKNISNKRPNLTLKAIRERGTKKAQS